MRQATRWRAAILLGGVAAAGTPVVAAADAREQPAEIVVRGLLPEPGAVVAGSFQILDADALRRASAITIKDVVRRLPGVQVIDEDALGLKLNISVRGLNPRRSGRTLLLEDGAPIQAAPYADPSAHYYPPLDRIDRIEFRKGSGQILYGPQSIGGMINFVTRPVPESTGIGAALSAGERGFFGARLSAGMGNATAGLWFDLIRKQGDGTRAFHATRIDEAAIKARVALGPGHALMVKAAHYTEATSLTEGGLTQARFDADPYGNPFRNDRFVLTRMAAQAVHHWQIADRATLSTQLYYADTARASYRQADTSTDAMTANPATGCVGAARTDYEAFAGLCGNKMRPRRFRFWGVEPRLAWQHRLFGLPGEALLGVRGHFEATNRKRYNGLTPAARENTPGSVLRDDNDIAVNAFSAYAQETVRAGDWSLTPGMRIERIETINRAKVANFVAIDRTARSTQTIMLPGIGITWAPSTRLTAFAGVHRGFAPPRPDRDYNPAAPFNAVRPERSVETEFGLRGQPRPGATLDVTVFELKLDDLIVEGPLVDGRSGTFVNAGRALHRGLEISGKARLGRARISGNYTYLFTAKFLSDVEETVRGVRGNRIPYAPEHLFDLAIGYEFGAGFGFEIGVNHVAEQFANASNSRAASPDGQTGIIPARTLYRLAGHFEPEHGKYRVFVTAENILDTAFIASRVDGLFAGSRRSIVAGITTGF